MRRVSTFTGALISATSMTLIGTAAVAQSMNPAMSPAASPTEQKPIQASQATIDYVQKAAIGNLFEIQSSDLALKQADNSAVKAFAQQMINDHTTSTQALESGVKSASLQATQIPNKLDSVHEAKLNDLRKVTGHDFDSAYLRAQLAAHQDALKLHQDYAQRGDSAVLKKTAANAADIVEHHLQELRKISQGVPQTSSTGGSR